MKRLIVLSLITTQIVSCTTLNQSLKLGAATGALAGAMATYGAEKARNYEPTVENVAVGASVGLALGLITSYFVHQSVNEEREENSRKTEIYFGDLPPSPFVIPSKKGGK